MVRGRLAGNDTALVQRRRACGHRSGWFALLGAMALFVSACGGAGTTSEQPPSPQNPVTITFANWADAEQATRPGIQEMIAKFQASHPGIIIKSEAISFSDIGHNLQLRVQSGNPPDVAELSGNDTFAIAATRGLATLDTYLGNLTNSFISSERAAATYQGKLIAMPWTVNPPGLWYNKRLLAGAGLDPNRPPQTSDELMSDLAAVHAKYPDVIPLGLDTTNRDFALTSNWSWMKAFGAEPFHGTTASANTPQMNAYLSWVRELTQKGYTVAGKKIGDFRPLAAQDKVAFIWDQPVLQGVVQQANHQSNDQFFATWGVAPQPSGSAGKPASVELGHQLVLFDKSAHKQAAAEFMKWLATSPEAVSGYTLKYESSLPPISNPTPDVAQLLTTPVLQAFNKDVLPTVSNPPFGPTYGEAYSPIMAGVQRAATSNDPIDGIARDIQSGLEAAFK